MAALTLRVVGALRAWRLAGPGDRVVAAVSGGPDSVALVHLLRAALPEVGAALVGLAHLHHGLRGEDADADEAFCLGLAGELGLPCEVERVDVAALCRQSGRSREAEGHAARYAFFDRARIRLGATLVATGHTRDDQAETFLLRALRGAGLRGLGGIRRRTGCVIRPLLDVRRCEILAWLEEAGLPFREDSSNADRSIPRNLLRHEVVPFLASRFGPAVTDALARAAHLAADDDACLEAAAAEQAGTVVEAGTDGVWLDATALGALPVAIRRRIVLGTLARAAPGRFVGSRHAEAVVRLAERGREGAVVQLPGSRATRRGHRIHLEGVQCERGGRPPAGQARPAVAPRVLTVPGSVVLEESAVEVSVERLSRAAAGDPAAHPCAAMVDAAAAGEPLLVRGRRPGDRLRPLGLAGRKKVQDLLVDRKVPRQERDRVPIVTDAGGRIVWVAGHAIAHDFRVTAATTGVLLLKYRRLGGCAG
jgi:tRNA(Ile)-lysidine synthase